MTNGKTFKVRRREVLKLAAAAGAVQLAAPFVVTARAADTVKIGLDDPFTGTYAELGKHEKIGCELAVSEINAKGGILGRKVELVSEDFDQHQYRHRGAEGAQADRSRQGRLPARQR